jgi:hypothetical protein
MTQKFFFVTHKNLQQISLSFLLSFQQIKYEIDPEYLFSPSNGEGKSERQVVEQYFKVNYTHRFNVGRITRAGKTIKCDQRELNLLFNGD